MFRLMIGMPDLSTKRAIAGWIVGIALFGTITFAGVAAGYTFGRLSRRSE